MSMGDAEEMNARLPSLLGYQSRSAPFLLICLFY